jgi:Cd2+/Zn2+-exporting ATPase
VFLVVSCPCALVISVPLALYAGIGKASSIGALIKGGNFLEMLKDVDTIVFDKTNTITKGDFEVIKLEGDIIENLAYAEFYSNHPIAKSIVTYYNKSIDKNKIKEFNEVIGKGIDVFVNDVHVNVGNFEYLKELNINIKPILSINTIIYVVVDNIYQGYLEIGDVLKTNAQQIINELNVNYQTVMLTGDKHSVAEDIAKKVGIKSFFSDLLPIDKVDKMEKLVISGKNVMFVGDGINDGPVLAKSNIGVAMGAKGSELAKDVADIILMNDNLKSIVDVLKISKYTNKIVIQNIVFALGIKVLVLILAAFGIANMWLGVFADVGVALLAILNSLRILKLKL